MKSISKTQELRPSVLDRLIDSTPVLDISGDNSVTISRVRRSIRRDLENLLNTRRPFSRKDPARSQRELSIVDYGVPDFTGASFSTQAEQESLVREIKRVIEAYELRFKSVKIIERKKMDNIDRTVHFRIEAELKVEPAVEPLVFDTHIDPVSRELNVEDAVNG